MVRSDAFLTSISVLFGVCVSLWATPFFSINLMNFAERWFDSILVFTTLVSLWWWYVVLLPATHPSSQYWHYLFDFAGLGAFALASRSWDRPKILFFLVGCATVIILLRFSWAFFYYYKHTWKKKNNSNGRLFKQAFASCMIIIMSKKEKINVPSIYTVALACPAILALALFLVLIALGGWTVAGADSGIARFQRLLILFDGATVQRWCRIAIIFGILMTIFWGYIILRVGEILSDRRPAATKTEKRATVKGREVSGA